MAVIYSVGLHDMGIYCQQFTTRYSQAKIRLAYLHPHEVVEAVINDEADLGILSFPSPHRSLTIIRSEEHTSELQSHSDLVCRLLLEKKNSIDKVPMRE